ncbi:hypothetical protein BD410DRAFT_795588 [Rickenella mellea]|uniref:Uncharacterized protein n=1 Tax=Rickenella mellea TaxID=50990 RepID=A0A4Y7PLY9_9AGAM|nr:hypothetical protein BD410DRAFT_795588 [Rickenella mellea]
MACIQISYPHQKSSTGSDHDLSVYIVSEKSSSSPVSWLRCIDVVSPINKAGIAQT